MSERGRKAREDEEKGGGKKACGHGVCESELVGVRKCVCARICPLGAFRQNRLECADPTETHWEEERGCDGGGGGGGSERKMLRSRSDEGRGWKKKVK